MTFNVVTVANSIAALTFPGVTVQDLDETRDAVDPRRCPVLRPYPQAGFELTALDDMSFGSTSAKKDIVYTLTYALFFAPLGSDRGLHIILPEMWAAASTVLGVFRDNDTLTGAVDVRPTSARQAGVILDPADNPYHGVLITLTVLEHSD